MRPLHGARPCFLLGSEPHLARVPSPTVGANDHSPADPPSGDCAGGEWLR
jgi:hypothetical protein